MEQQLLPEELLIEAVRPSTHERTFFDILGMASRDVVINKGNKYILDTGEDHSLAAIGTDARLGLTARRLKLEGKAGYSFKKIKSALIISLFFIIAASCKKGDLNLYIPGKIPSTFHKEITRYVIFYGNDSVVCSINGDIITGNIPDYFAGRKNLKARFESIGTVKIGDTIFSAGNMTNSYEKPLNIDVIGKDRSVRHYTVSLTSFNGLPNFWLNPIANVSSKEDYIETPFKLDVLDSIYSGTTTMRGRGNSSWGKPKNPYKIKFDNKTAFFGWPEDKEWAILANWFDKSLLRNDVAFELSERLKREWTPKRKFIDVFMWGQYNGNYLLTETIKEAKDRVNIDVKKGGYLIEANMKENEGDPRFFMPYYLPERPGEPVLPFDIKDGNVTPEKAKADFMKLYVAVTTYQTDSISGWRRYFDEDALLSWYIVAEIMGCPDMAFYSSVFIQKKDSLSKFKMGPVWDFDLSSGNYGGVWEDPTGWYMNSTFLLNGIFRYDPTFKPLLRLKWNEYRDAIMTLPDYIDKQAKALDLSQQANYVRFPVLNVKTGAQVFFPGTYQGEVDYFRNWMKARIEWLDKELNK